MTSEPSSNRSALARRALVTPRPPVHLYPLHATLTARELRTLITAESIEALQLTRAAGLEVPHDAHYR